MLPTRPTAPIFRAAALQHYRRGRTAVLPPLLAPRTTVALWGLLTLFVIAGALAWTVEVPRVAHGMATVVRGADGAAPTLVAFFPPETGSRLRVGTLLLVALDQREARVPLAISVVAPELYSPADARARYGLSADALPDAPSRVALAQLEPAVGGRAGALYAGGSYPVETVIGTRRVLTLLPLVGALFEE